MSASPPSVVSRSSPTGRDHVFRCRYPYATCSKSSRSSKSRSSGSRWPLDWLRSSLASSSCGQADESRQRHLSFPVPAVGRFSRVAVRMSVVGPSRTYCAVCAWSASWGQADNHAAARSSFSARASRSDHPVAVCRAFASAHGARIQTSRPLRDWYRSLSPFAYGSSPYAAAHSEISLILRHARLAGLFQERPNV